MAQDVSRFNTRFLFWLALITVLAVAIRENFVLTTIVDDPFRGDPRQYAAYAWNLLHHGIYSLTQPDLATPAPDAYRTPGYPWLIAACMALRPEGNWYALVMQAQVLLGTATVTLVALLGRYWLPSWAALVAAALLALWPHHIVATDVLLSEVLFGFTLIIALWLYARRSLAMSGAMFGLSYLVNPLVALFPPFLAWLQHRHIGRRALAGFLCLFLVPVVALAIRNATVDIPPTSQPGRMAANLVQGSWPLYHAAQNDAHLGKPIPMAIMQEISDEAALLDVDPTAGLAAMGKRMGKQPGLYAAWYVWDKPRLLWDWDIRVGVGGPYFLDVRNSPLETQPLLHAITQGYRAINPLLTFLAFCGAMMIAVIAVRARAAKPASAFASPAAIATALLAIYLTALHTVLQAEPRYANAYRGIEALLVATAAAGVVNVIRATFTTWRRPPQLADRQRAPEQ